MQVTPILRKIFFSCLICLRNVYGDHTFFDHMADELARVFPCLSLTKRDKSDKQQADDPRGVWRARLVNAFENYRNRPPVSEIIQSNFAENP